ncbi:MAG: acyl carrier protein [Streptomyces sp.]|nr:acyl carrier protein [Streptomyces sp.]
MNSLDDFLTLVHDEVGLLVTPQTVADEWDQLPGWDSVLLITLLSAIERRTARPVSLPEMLQARNLEEVYQLAMAR